MANTDFCQTPQTTLHPLNYLHITHHTPTSCLCHQLTHPPSLHCCFTTLSLVHHNA